MKKVIENYVAERSGTNWKKYNFKSSENCKNTDTYLIVFLLFIFAVIYSFK